MKHNLFFHITISRGNGSSHAHYLLTARYWTRPYNFIPASPQVPLITHSRCCRDTTLKAVSLKKVFTSGPRQKFTYWKVREMKGEKENQMEMQRQWNGKPQRIQLGQTLSENSPTKATVVRYLHATSQWDLWLQWWINPQLKLNCKYCCGVTS